MTQGADRRSLVALAGAGLALALSVTGCSFDFSVGDPEPLAAETEEAGSVTAGDETPPPAPGGEEGGVEEGGGALGVCEPGQLLAELHEQPSGSAAEVRAILTLSNASTRDCVLPKGWAPLGQGGGGGPYFAAVEGAREPHPNAGTNITLRPGATAYAGLKWGTSPQCPSAGGWAVAWRDGWLPAKVTWQDGPRDICPGTFAQGTLQPTPNDVNYG